MTLTPDSPDARPKIKVDALAKLPYKTPPFNSRYWGHPYHFFISYPSKLKPSIAHFLVRYFSQPGDKVLDPFSGIGTIPFEACAQGRIGMGSDINPVAFHATRAKVQKPDKNIINSQMKELKAYVDSANIVHNLHPNEKEIREYYHPKTFDELLKARDFLIFNHHDDDYSFIICCLAHILHGNRPYALSRRSHNIMPWAPQGDFIYKPVVEWTQKKIDKMLSKPLPLTFHLGESFQKDVMKLPFQSESINAILTSPPFHNNRDFLRMNRIRLWFCGWDYDYQKEIRKTFVENTDTIEIYSGIFTQFYKILRPSGYCVLHLGVVGNFDMGKEIEPLAKKIGFKSYGVVYEDTANMESQGIRDRGATQKHQFLILRKD